MFQGEFGKNARGTGDSGAKKEGIRTFFKFSWIVVLIGIFVVGGIFYARWQENRDIEEKAAAARRAKARQLVEDFGGNRFEILSFYATREVIHAGDDGTICYGVSNAKSVSLEPKAAEEVWPSLSRCVQVSPKKTTTYKLTISDSAGNKKSATVVLTVQ